MFGNSMDAFLLIVDLDSFYSTHSLFSAAGCNLTLSFPPQAVPLGP
jgi:hypothetical protein